MTGTIVNTPKTEWLRRKYRGKYQLGNTEGERYFSVKVKDTFLNKETRGSTFFCLMPIKAHVLPQSPPANFAMGDE